jgi:hypothetical protein
LRIQQRAAFLFSGQQNELPVYTIVVEVKLVVQLVTNLGGIAGNIDVKIGRSTKAGESIWIRLPNIRPF